MLTTSPAPMASVSISHPYLSSGQIFGQPSLPPPPPVVTGGGGGSGGAVVVGAATGSSGESVGVSSQSGTNANTGRGPFASALRNLAKQADIKEDDPVSVNNSNEQTRTNSNSAFTSSSAGIASGVAANKRSASAGDQMLDNSRDNIRKTQLSPQPPEKVSNIQRLFSLFSFV